MQICIKEPILIRYLKYLLEIEYGSKFWSNEVIIEYIGYNITFCEYLVLLGQL